MTATSKLDPGVRTRALVVHPHLKADRDQRRDPESALAECVALTEALDFEVVSAEIATLATVKAGALFGSGKIDVIKARVAAGDAELVIVDGAVTPIQQRNLEKAWNAKVLDRTGLILEIFGERAGTREGALQVELAHLTYQKSRLVRSWTHLERQRGGAGFMGGPGETQIEADRRAIDTQIMRLRRQLDKVAKTRELHRKARRRVPYPLIALVGYTNAGKSTLFNRLTGSDVMVKDMLFATLDPTMRAISLPGGLQVIVSDTVGFISDLPTQLVAAFRATLEEVLEADLVVHVRDIAHPQTDAQAQDVQTILRELGVRDTVPRLEVWNKVDLLAPDDPQPAIARRRDSVVAVSALSGQGLDALVDTMARALGEARCVETVEIGFEHGRARSWAYKEGIVEAEQISEDGVLLTLFWSPRQRCRFEALLFDAP